MKITYCEGWSRHFKRIRDLISEKEAKRRDKIEKLYSVIIGELESPFCFIEINKGFYGVSFLDELKREYLSYNFAEKKIGLLFLTEAVYTTYEENTDNMILHEDYLFSTDGSVRIEKRRTNSEEFEFTEKKLILVKTGKRNQNLGNTIV